jgi:hypothetical protein
MIPQLRRRDDACIIVSQDNLRKKITVDHIDDNAAAMLGMKAKVAECSLPLESILDARVRTLLHDYVDFEDLAHDLGHALRRINKVNLVCANGNSIPVQLRIFSYHSEQHGSLCFQLWLRPNSLQENIDKFKLEFQSGKYASCDITDSHGHLEADSLSNTIDMLCDFHKEGAHSLNLVIIAASPKNEKSPKGLAHDLRSIVRRSDYVGVIEDSAATAMLMGCPPEHCDAASGRIWRTLHSWGQPVALSFCHIKEHNDHSSAALLEDLQRGLETSHNDGRAHKIQRTPQT